MLLQFSGETGLTRAPRGDFHYVGRVCAILLQPDVQQAALSRKAGKFRMDENTKPQHAYFE